MLNRIRRKYKISIRDYKLILSQVKILAYKEGCVDGEIYALYKQVRHNIPCDGDNDYEGISFDTPNQQWAILYLQQFKDKAQETKQSK